MINVLSLVTFKVFPPQMGGEKGVAFFYGHLKPFVNITIAASSNNASKDLDVIEVLSANRTIYLNFFSIKKLKKIINEKGIDVIIVEHSYPAWIAYLLSKQTGIPFIIHSHNIEAHRFKLMKRWWWKRYLKYESWIHKKAAFNFFISEEDKEFAIKEFGVDNLKCSVIPYGVSVKKTIKQDKEALRKDLQLPVDEYIFLFNGTLDYKPNVDAVESLLENIEPLLQNQFSNFKIVICGKNLNEAQQQKLKRNDHFIYKGFVPDIDDYYKAADLFLNPVINNSGVKTKVVEALANNCTTISFNSGAAGIPMELCNDKLIKEEDDNWQKFSEAIFLHKDSTTNTPPSFYNYFDWNNIAQNAFEKIQQVVTKK